MSKLLAKPKSVIVWLYNHLGDPRTKNTIICVLLALTAFGMLAPQQATMLRDMVLSMPA
jgi:hypothetical protein